MNGHVQDRTNDSIRLRKGLQHILDFVDIGFVSFIEKPSLPDLLVQAQKGSKYRPDLASDSHHRQTGNTALFTTRGSKRFPFSKT